MLAELSIRNFAIIEQLRLQFGPGFSVLTGETGTGKSIIIDAVSLLLGERASTDLIRTGSDSATIEAVFTLSPDLAASLNPILEEQGLADGNELILRREISRNRRSICRVNGHAVTLTAFQEIGHHLIDIHGQGEHLSLMQVRRHVDFLDRYAGLVSPRQEFAAQVERLRRVRRELANLRRDERELARRVDLLTYQIQEIEAAALQPGEEDELRRQRTLLANAEKRMQLSARIYDLLSQGEEEQRSAADLLSDASESLTDLARLDDALAEESRQLEGLLDQLEDLARTMRNYRDEIEYDPRGLEEVEERIELIHELERKYGDSIEDVLEFARRAQEELDNISHSEERLEELMAEEAALLRGIAARGQALSAARREAAGRLSRDIEEQLADLNMENARFMVDMRYTEDDEGAEVDGRRYAFDATGLDRVEFLIAPNPGEEPRPLVRIASGGETSRLMLAMKTALSNIDPVPVLIFDEIDSGIGGRTGAVVGQKLWQLAADHQVFCVTHLAQIACYGRQHFRVAKEVVEGRTISQARELALDERIDELAVMLGGASTEANRRSARELLQRVAEMA
ncbi:MAG TPA: DNA repair protein RecN [Chloroflexi bacterium]|nr:DNA repair protein RecN [Chloroflexota bacterium]